MSSSNGDRWTDKVKAMCKKKANGLCFDCGESGANYAVISLQDALGVFVCNTCAGLHRDLNHKVKGVSMSNFKEDEAVFLENMGGNKPQRCMWWAFFPPADAVRIDGTNKESMKSLLHALYVQKRWHVDSPSNRGKTPYIQSGEGAEGAGARLGQVRSVGGVAPQPPQAHAPPPSGGGCGDSYDFSSSSSSSRAAAVSTSFGFDPPATQPDRRRGSSGVGAGSVRKAHADDAFGFDSFSSALPSRMEDDPFSGSGLAYNGPVPPTVSSSSRPPPPGAPVDDPFSLAAPPFPAAMAAATSSAPAGVGRAGAHALGGRPPPGPGSPAGVPQLGGGGVSAAAAARLRARGQSGGGGGGAPLTRTGSTSSITPSAHAALQALESYYGTDGGAPSAGGGGGGGGGFDVFDASTARPSGAVRSHGGVGVGGVGGGSDAWADFGVGASASPFSSPPAPTASALAPGGGRKGSSILDSLGDLYAAGPPLPQPPIQQQQAATGGADIFSLGFGGAGLPPTLPVTPSSFSSAPALGPAHLNPFTTPAKAPAFGGYGGAGPAHPPTHPSFPASDPFATPVQGGGARPGQAQHGCGAYDGAPQPQWGASSYTVVAPAAAPPAPAPPNPFDMF